MRAFVLCCGVFLAGCANYSTEQIAMAQKMSDAAEIKCLHDMTWPRAFEGAYICANNRMLEEFESVHFPYMDILHVYASERVAIARDTDATIEAKQPPEDPMQRLTAARLRMVAAVDRMESARQAVGAYAAMGMGSALQSYGAAVAAPRAPIFTAPTFTTCHPAPGGGVHCF